MQDKLDGAIASMQEEILKEARNIYTETVIDHWMNPRGFGSMKEASGHARITGRCGDTMEIYLRIADGFVTQARFLTDGCATTIASASMAVELAQKKDVAEVEEISQELILRCLGGLPEESEHCALLASTTLKAAVEDYRSTLKEEERV